MPHRRRDRDFMADLDRRIARYDALPPWRKRLEDVLHCARHPKARIYDRYRVALIRFWGRGRRGWSYPDVWSLDCYIAQMMAGSLAHLADVRHAHSWWALEMASTQLGIPHCMEHIPEEVADLATTLEDARLRRLAATFAGYADRDDLPAPDAQRAAQAALRGVADILPELWD